MNLSFPIVASNARYMIPTPKMKAAETDIMFKIVFIFAIAKIVIVLFGNVFVFAKLF